MGKRRIKVTVWNVLIQISGDVHAAYLSEYADVEDVTTAQSTWWDGIQWLFFNHVPKKKWIPGHSPNVGLRRASHDGIVEGRRFQCWNCKQLGHISRSCPQKTTQNTTSPSTAATTTTGTIASTSTATLTNPQKTESGDHTNKKEGWIKNSPTKLENTTQIVITAAKETALTPEKIKSPAPSNKKEKKKKKKKTTHRRNSLRRWKLPQI